MSYIVSSGHPELMHSQVKSYIVSGGHSELLDIEVSEPVQHHNSTCRYSEDQALSGQPQIYGLKTFLFPEQ